MVEWATAQGAQDWATLASGATQDAGKPRFFLDATLIRPTVGSTGDLTFPAGTAVRAAVWPRRRKAVVGDQGELHEITAVGFLPAGTDVARRDRLEIAAGEPGGPARYEIITVVAALDDRRGNDHVAVELVGAAEPVGS